MPMTVQYQTEIPNVGMPNAHAAVIGTIRIADYYILHLLQKICIKFQTLFLLYCISDSCLIGFDEQSTNTWLKQNYLVKQVFAEIVLKGFALLQWSDVDAGRHGKIANGGHAQRFTGIGERSSYVLVGWNS